jgi:hypothetical protein
MAELTSTQVWAEIEKQLFGIIGMVTAKGEARTAGVIYLVRQHKFYFSASKKDWKTRHIAQNPHVSMTIPIAKRILFLPWIKLPPVTITFPGIARVLEPEAVPAGVEEALHQGLKLPPDSSASLAIIEVTPEKEFITYGLGVSPQTMRDTEKARGRVAVN